MGMRKKPGARGGKETGLIPLLPRHRVRLSVIEYSYPAEPKRFVRLFREVWRGVPLADRRRLLKHWRMVALDQWPTLPLVELIDWKSDFTRGPRGTYPMSQMRPGVLTHFSFCSRAFRVLNDAQCRNLIAHELAHSYDDACGRNFHEEDDVPYEERLCEMDADETADRWGFKDQPLTRDQTRTLYEIHCDQLKDNPERLERLHKERASVLAIERAEDAKAAGLPEEEVTRLYQEALSLMRKSMEEEETRCTGNGVTARGARESR